MTTSQHVYKQFIFRAIESAAGQAVDIEDLYKAVEDNVTFDEEDLQPVRNERVNEPTWKRNVRNTLQRLKRSFELVNHARNFWRLPTPNPSAALDPVSSWARALRVAETARDQQTVFESRQQRHRYKVLELSESKVVVERLDGNQPETLSKTDFEQAIGFLNAAGGRAGRRTLNYTVAKEEAIVFLDPELQWDEAGEFIEVVQALDEPVYWALLCNPSRYRIDAALSELSEDLWTVSRGDIHEGDRVAIWRAAGGGTRRGIVALGTALTEPAELVEPEHLLQYWVDQPPSDEAVRRVWILYQSRPNLPIWLDEDTTGLLAELSVSRATGGTVFRITPDHWSRLEELAGGSSELLEEPIEFDNAPEGRMQLRLHKHRERNPRLARRKKQQTLQRFGCLKCEVCEFDFREFYGDLGEGFVECHHGLPVASLQPGHVTHLEDLHLVCANCHRMLHVGGQVRSIQDLTKIISGVRSS